MQEVDEEEVEVEDFQRNIESTIKAAAEFTALINLGEIVSISLCKWIKYNRSFMMLW